MVYLILYVYKVDGNIAHQNFIWVKDDWNHAVEMLKSAGYKDENILVLEQPNVSPEIFEGIPESFKGL